MKIIILKNSLELGARISSFKNHKSHN